MAAWFFTTGLTTMAGMIGGASVGGRICPSFFRGHMSTELLGMFIGAIGGSGLGACGGFFLGSEVVYPIVSEAWSGTNRSWANPAGSGGPHNARCGENYPYAWTGRR